MKIQIVFNFNGLEKMRYGITHLYNATKLPLLNADRAINKMDLTCSQFSIDAQIPIASSPPFKSHFYT
jgi:hypothetical protein